MSRVSTLGGFSDELWEETLEQMKGEIDFAETPELSTRVQDGRVSAGGFIDQHFDFGDGLGRQPVAPFSEKEIKARMKALKAERETLKQQYPSNIEKDKKIRDQLQDYARQLKVDQQAAYAGMLQMANGGDRPPIMGREALMDDIMKDEPKHGKLNPGSDETGKELVDAYNKYQDRAYATQVDASGSLLPAAKRKATPMSGSTGPGGTYGMDDLDQLVAGSKAYWKAAQGRREARKKAK